jgi:hypothetical protein
MSLSFTVGGHYPITANRFWDEVFFTEIYTKDLFLNGLKFPAVEILKCEKHSDGETHRSLKVTPRLSLPTALKRLVKGGLLYVETGFFDPDSKIFKSTITVPASPKLLIINTQMRFVDSPSGGCDRHVQFDVRSSTFGIARLVEKTAKAVLTQQYNAAESFSRHWIKSHVKPD